MSNSVTTRIEAEHQPNLLDGIVHSDDARAVLGLDPVSFNVTAGANVSITAQSSFAAGKVGVLSLRFKITADGVTTVGTIPAGYRPKDDVFYDCFAGGGTAVAFAISSDGSVVTGQARVTNTEYRVLIPYAIA